MKLKKIFMTALENPLRTKKKKKQRKLLKCIVFSGALLVFFFNVKVVYFSGEIIKLIMFIPTSIKWIDKYNI
jgi:hypothetical protein